MKFLTALFLSLSLFLISACIDEKQDTKHDNFNSIIVMNSYSFITTATAATGAGFMEIENHGNEDETLVSAASDVAEFTEIHENLIDPDDGTMMMRKIKSLPIPAGEKVELTPKGYHIMFIKLKQPFKMGDVVPVTLNFEKAGSKNIELEIVAPGAPAPHIKH